MSQAGTAQMCMDVYGHKLLIDWLIILLIECTKCVFHFTEKQSDTENK